MEGLLTSNMENNLNGTTAGNEARAFPHRLSRESGASVVVATAGYVCLVQS